MNHYEEPLQKLIPKDEKQIYIFYHSSTELITVQFIKWINDKITKAKFTIHASDTHRTLHSTGICPALADDNKYRLSLHSLFSKDRPDPFKKSYILDVDNLNIPSGGQLELGYIRYYEDEVYNEDWTCHSYGDGVPDVKKGNILLGQ